MRKTAYTIITAALMLLVSVSANAGLIRVSQETSAGAGDFDSNILGSILTYSSPLTTAGFYQYGSPDGASYNGDANGGPAAVSDTTINFFVTTSDGLSFYNVHDAPTDGTGGSVEMSLSLTGGDTAAFMSNDDNGEPLSPGLGVQGTSFTTDHVWVGCCTDGFSLGTIEGAGWALFSEFDSNDLFGGGDIDYWTAMSADGGTISLNLGLNQRVRFDLAPVPEPSMLILLGLGLAGLGSRRRKAL